MSNASDREIQKGLVNCYLGGAEGDISDAYLNAKRAFSSRAGREDLTSFTNKRLPGRGYTWRATGAAVNQHVKQLPPDKSGHHSGHEAGTLGSAKPADVLERKTRLKGPEASDTCSAAS